MRNTLRSAQLSYDNRLPPEPEPEPDIEYALYYLHIQHNINTNGMNAKEVMDLFSEMWAEDMFDCHDDFDDYPF